MTGLCKDGEPMVNVSFASAVTGQQLTKIDQMSCNERSRRASEAPRILRTIFSLCYRIARTILVHEVRSLPDYLISRAVLCEDGCLVYSTLFVVRRGERFDELYNDARWPWDATACVLSGRTSMLPCLATSTYRCCREPAIPQQSSKPPLCC